MRDTLITGAAGFIGGHLYPMLGGNAACRGLDIVPANLRGSLPLLQADIRAADQLHKVLEGRQGGDLVHLAAKAEVVIPFDGLADLMETNIQGTLRVLEAARPRRVIFASSSSVYGETAADGDAPAWENLNPLGAYALTKMAGEMACADWAAEAGAMVVNLRLGNVVGAGCRGLIPYLVRHATRHPAGDVPVRLRGDGRLLRDYVPVEHVLEVIAAALQAPEIPGSVQCLNVAAGRALSNGEVTAMVQSVLAGKGYRLRPDFRDPPARGETHRTVLAVEGTLRLYDVPPVRPDAVEAAIEAAVLQALADETGGG
jgi:nucleoside-diphosphate-sugar epimerase